MLGMIEWYKKGDRCAVFLKIITEPVIKKERERGIKVTRDCLKRYSFLLRVKNPGGSGP